MAGSDPKLVYVRVTALSGAVEAVAGKISDVLEQCGHEVIEWSEPKPCKAPDESKSRVYLTAISKGA